MSIIAYYFCNTYYLYNITKSYYGYGFCSMQLKSSTTQLVGVERRQGRVPLPSVYPPKRGRVAKTNLSSLHVNKRDLLVLGATRV